MSKFQFQPDPTETPVQNTFHPRSYIFSSNSEALILQSPLNETRLSFINSSATNNITTIDNNLSRYILSSSNQQFSILSNQTQIAQFSTTPSGIPNVHIPGMLYSSNMTFLPQTGNSSRKLVILNDYNPSSLSQFAGFGYANQNTLAYQVPSRSSKHVFYASDLNLGDASVEWMRIQQDPYTQIPQVGIGITTSMQSNVSLQVAGNTIISGSLTVQNGIFGLDSSQFVTLDPTTYRINSNLLPQNLVVTSTSSNTIDTSILPITYTSQFLRTQKNVGIGTRTPFQRLHIQGSQYVSDRIGIGTTVPLSRLHVLETTAAIPSVLIQNSAGGDLLNVSLQNGCNALYVTANGGVGVGTSNINPAYSLQVIGNAHIEGLLSCSNFSFSGAFDADTLNIVTNNYSILRFEMTTPPNGIYQEVLHSSATTIFDKNVHVTGNLIASSNTYLSTAPIITSDKRLKSDIRKITYPLEKLSGIHGYTYSITHDPYHREAGVLAQEVIESLPEAVHTLEYNDYLGVKYDALIPLLIESIHELKKRIEVLEKSNSKNIL